MTRFLRPERSPGRSARRSARVSADVPWFLTVNRNPEPRKMRAKKQEQDGSDPASALRAAPPVDGRAGGRYRPAASIPLLGPQTIH